MFKKPQKNTSQYEYCEVSVTEPKYEVNRYVFRFFAQATAPQETYTASIAKEKCIGRQPYSDDTQTQLTLEHFREQLISEGWEVLSEKGAKWYNIRFKREYKPDRAKN